MRFTPQAIKALSLPPGKSEHWEWDRVFPALGCACGPVSNATTCSTGGTVRARSSPSGIRRRLACHRLVKPLGASLPGCSSAMIRNPRSVRLRRPLPSHLARSHSSTWAVPQSQGYDSFEEVERHLTRLWAPLGNMELDRLGLQHVAARLGEIATENGPVAANRARASLSALFGWAMREGLAASNPVLFSNKATDERSRDRVLTDAEL